MPRNVLRSIAPPWVASKTSGGLEPVPRSARGRARNRDSRPDMPHDRVLFGRTLPVKATRLRRCSVRFVGADGCVAYPQFTASNLGIQTDGGFSIGRRNRRIWARGTAVLAGKLEPPYPYSDSANWFLGSDEDSGTGGGEDSRHSDMRERLFRSGSQFGTFRAKGVGCVLARPSDAAGDGSQRIRHPRLVALVGQPRAAAGQ